VRSGGDVASTGTGRAQPEFIVSVEPIKDQIQKVKDKLYALEKKDPSTREKVQDELSILRKVWDDLGNLTF
jgi:hypothetical protein